jgi:hypothetical protein
MPYLYAQGLSDIGQPSDTRRVYPSLYEAYKVDGITKFFGEIFLSKRTRSSNLADTYTQNLLQGSHPLSLDARGVLKH